MPRCLSKTFTVSPDLPGTPLVLDTWLPLDAGRIVSASVTLFAGEEAVRAILEEAGGAILDESGGAVLEE